MPSPDKRLVKAVRTLQQQPRRDARPLARAEVARSSVYGVSNNSTTPIIPWTDEIDNPDDMWSSALNTRLTVPADGLYLSYVFAQWVANSSGMRRLQLRKNGSTIVASETQGSNSTTTVDMIFVAAISLVEGDYLEVMPWQTSGASLNINANTYSLIWRLMCIQ